MSDLGGFSMYELFRAEVDTHCAALSDLHFHPRDRQTFISASLDGSVKQALGNLYIAETPEVLERAVDESIRRWLPAAPPEAIADADDLRGVREAAGRAAGGLVSYSRDRAAGGICGRQKLQRHRGAVRHQEERGDGKTRAA
jgi:hypothetical protein